MHSFAQPYYAGLLRRNCPSSRQQNSYTIEFHSMRGLIKLIGYFYSLLSNSLRRLMMAISLIINMAWSTIKSKLRAEGPRMAVKSPSSSTATLSKAMLPTSNVGRDQIEADKQSYHMVSKTVNLTTSLENIYIQPEKFCGLSSKIVEKLSQGFCPHIFELESGAFIIHATAEIALEGHVPVYVSLQRINSRVKLGFASKTASITLKKEQALKNGLWIKSASPISSGDLYCLPEPYRFENFMVIQKKGLLLNMELPDELVTKCIQFIPDLGLRVDSSTFALILCIELDVDELIRPGFLINWRGMMFMITDQYDMADKKLFILAKAVQCHAQWIKIKKFND